MNYWTKMTNQDKKLLFKEICARMPYGVLVQVDGKTYNVIGVDDNTMKVRCVRLGLDSDIVMTFDVEDTKLMLRPMSEMTADEKDHYNKLKALQIILERAEPWVLVDFLHKKSLDYRGLIDRSLAVHCLL